MSRARTVLAALGVGALLVVPITSSTASAADSRQDAYTKAAEEFDVPVDVLLAVSYLETRWDTHDGEPSRAAGYGPMHLTDIDTATGHDETAHGSHATPEDRRGDDARPDAPHGSVLRTVDLAADLTGESKASLRSDPAANIRGGAALLAHYQREIDGPATSDPAQWYGAVAKYSGATDEKSAAWFADEAYDILAQGKQRRTDDGHRLELEPNAAEPATSMLDRLDLRTTNSDGTADTECPPSLGCEWIPAPYEEFGEDSYGNHDKANRPESQRIRYIVIHDTETSYGNTLDLVQDPEYVSWQYTMRNSDGHTAQHVKWKDVAWQAGNWYINSKSIGIEHEGYGARGTWYSEAMYRKSALLVSYIARENNIPLDRHHIIGHDNVPGTTPETIPGMHWDPGPYWDWAHYFDLLGKPIRSTGTAHSGMVTINPDFDSNNPGFFGCEDNPGPPGEGEPPECGDWGSSAVVLRTDPSHDAELLKDVGVNPPNGHSTLRVNDIGSRVSTGQQYAVADIRGDWTAIWFHGQKGWFYNPPEHRNAVWSSGLVVTPEAGKESVPVYGRAYPEPEAYPEGVPVQEIEELPYELNQDERYVLGQLPETEYYWATTYDESEGHVVVRGNMRYCQIQVGHRIGFVKASDVDVRPSWLWHP